jgi:hypothetical protein
MALPGAGSSATEMRHAGLVIVKPMDVGRAGMTGTDCPASPVGGGAGGAAIGRDVTDRQRLATVFDGGVGHGHRVARMWAGRQGRSCSKPSGAHELARCHGCRDFIGHQRPALMVVTPFWWPSARRSFEETLGRPFRRPSALAAWLPAPGWCPPAIGKPSAQSHQRTWQRQAPSSLAPLRPHFSACLCVAPKQEIRSIFDKLRSFNSSF